MPITPANNVEVQDEGTSQGRVRTVNFTGAGVSASVSGSVATVNVAGGGAATPWTEFTRDLGAAYRSGNFTLTGLSGLTAGEVREVVQTGTAIVSKGNATDEPEMDMILLTARALSTTELLVTWFAPSVVVGTYAFAWR